MNYRRNLLVPSAIVLSLAVTVLVLDRYGHNSRTFRSSGAIDAAQVEKRIVGTPGEAYACWKSRGLRGREAVFVADAWDRLDIDESPSIPMSRPYPLKPYDIARSFERNTVTQANLLFIASLNGIVRSVVAVLSPAAYAERSAGVQGFRGKGPSGGMVFQPHQGFPRWFTTPTGFRGSREPVLLYVGASIFKSTGPDELFRKLKDTGLQSDCVLLCLMDGDPGVTAREREKLVEFARLAGVPPPGERTPHLSTIPSASE